MKLSEIPKEELKAMNYADLAEAILVSKNTKMKVIDVFKKVCTIKEMSDQEFENKIADFFELLSMDKRFAILEKGYCDLSKKHIENIVLEDDEEEEEVIEEEDTIIEEETDEENTEEDIYYDNSSDEDDLDDDSDDELSDFLVVDEEEEASL